jgi:flagellar P-ring protein precursor FlgI
MTAPIVTHLRQDAWAPIRRLAARCPALLAAPALAIAVILAAQAPAAATSRIKDIADFEGVRENQLVGYGLVVGLNGTGDEVKDGGKGVFTRESLIGMLERLGVNARDVDLETNNVAAVMVTANLPPFSRQGSEVDVTVSALGDATSLQGGTLLVTPMLGADGEVYVVAQGQITIGGFSAAGAAESILRGVPTSGRIARGGIVEREVPFDIQALTQLNLSLRNPDFTTSQRIAAVINESTGRPVAYSRDSGTVVLDVGAGGGDAAALLAQIEGLPIEPDLPARVVIDENTGVIVMGENVRISKVAVAQGNLTIRITETPQVSQPNPFSNTGVTVVVPRTNVDVQEDADRKLAVVDSGVTLEELVTGLNALGVSPRDMLSILQTIKTAGALQADIMVQ